MDNLWLLTEERPKPSVVLQIINMYCRDFSDSAFCTGDIKIKPICVRQLESEPFASLKVNHLR